MSLGGLGADTPLVTLRISRRDSILLVSALSTWVCSGQNELETMARFDVLQRIVAGIGDEPGTVLKGLAGCGVQYCGLTRPHTHPDTDAV